MFSFIKDFGFPVVLSWFLLVLMENKLANLTDVIGELSCNIAAMRSDVAKKRKKKTVKDKLSILAMLSMTVCQKKNRQACNDSNNASGDFLRRKI